MKFYLGIFCALIIHFGVLSQQDSTHLSHKHPKNEIGIAFSPTYFLSDNITTFSAHIHFVHKIGHSKFGIGASFERVIFTPKHSTFGMVMTYEPIERLSFTFAPGVTIEDSNPVPIFSMHFESAYTFELGAFHLGPAMEYARDKNDSHLSLGIHVAYGF